MDWENLRHYSVFATHGSLAGAARVLGVEHATVARRIAALEAHLQVKLVDRRGRRLTLTPDGERIAAIARTMESGAEAIARAAAGARAELSGEVVISAPPAYATARLAAPLAALRKRHPKLEIRLLGEFRSSALERREADIAVRLSRPETGEFTITKLGVMTFRLYASRSYLDETPEPDRTFIGYDGSMATAPQEVRLREIAAGRPIAFTASTAEIQLAAAKAGAGIAILPDFMAEQDGMLVAVSDDGPVFRRDIWLVVHSDMKAVERIRVTIEALKTALAQEHGTS
ncbi:LysR family transcriptional regulator [Afifella marina]|uniref:Transcriptional regulator, LysR family n=1 Tax=Afifella marina DSM 2698 TaxID=1120955 RepID=A0A1G5P8X6_AFIMA|nr:LysR family transcriptional regulator [Afifella marina]MBK1624421.1 LysR family transcriptional regulator [Afifella marina DSM 2698]MBK1628153.1 LysR family transcriptional regulator [Afifella marina]MBK5916587.1 LysR family transcriptional regulator [Afifella marina]RAI18948.1 LysR family transcriptional regulator [Afifella marina DSM 2698]SCZ46022.1 transcriptional regulator, LysR family [Afifella marina DSM 2698]